METILKKRQLRRSDFRDIPSHTAYTQIRDKFLMSSDEYIVIDQSNLSEFVKTLIQNEKDVHQIDAVFFNRVDLDTCFDKGVVFDTCILFDSIVPDKSAFISCSSYGTSIGANSGLFHCHVEPLNGGRLRIGNDCYVADTSMMPGSILGKGSIYYSKFGTQTSFSHFESGVTVYGGCHFENTYAPGVNVFAFIDKLLPKDISHFLDKSNDGYVFDDFLGENASIYTHEYDFSLSAYGSMPFIEYPDKIYKTSQLINKTPYARNAFLNVLGAHNNSHEKHSTLTDKLFAAFSSSHAPYKSKDKIKSGRVEAFFELNSQFRKMSVAYLASVYKDAGYGDDCAELVNSGAVNELVKLVGDHCISSYNNTNDKTLERLNKYTQPAGVQIHKESLDSFLQKTKRVLTLHTGYEAPHRTIELKPE